MWLFGISLRPWAVLFVLGTFGFFFFHFFLFFLFAPSPLMFVYCVSGCVVIGDNLEKWILSAVGPVD